VLVLELLDALQRGRALLAADDEDVMITPSPGGSA
jgi:hypothetical protein